MKQIMPPIYTLLVTGGYDDYDEDDTIFNSLWNTLSYELAFEQYYNDYFL